jgi:murein DD-endopeptidase MepM/ murein hydrolase activator NlpD
VFSPLKDEQHPPPVDASFSPVFITARMRPPVSGVVTSAFGWRLHPITEATDFHTGIDVAAPEGHAIRAALPGRVSEVGYSRIYGNYVTIEHSGSLQTFYAHCSEVLVSEGMKVNQGERIAKVGSTGMSTGPHLHFAVVARGSSVNPYWALSDFIVVR